MNCLKKVEKYTIDMKEQDIDSLNMIKDFSVRIMSFTKEWSS